MSRHPSPSWIAAAAVVVLLLGGCAASRAPRRLPSDPCSVVTVDQVEAATHGNVLTSHLLPDTAMMRPSDPNPCEYVTDGLHGAISVNVAHNGVRDFLRIHGRDPRNTIDVGGIGDAAFIHGLSAIFVRLGNDYFAIGSQTGVGGPGSRDLERLAKAALENIGR
jgi:hypothetical protein